MGSIKWQTCTCNSNTSTSTTGDDAKLGRFQDYNMGCWIHCKDMWVPAPPLYSRRVRVQNAGFGIVPFDECDARGKLGPGLRY
jgi:hypothetical protein